jgi:hypothetical protein
MDKSIDSIGSCSLDADSTTDFSGNFNIKTGKWQRKKWETEYTDGGIVSLADA